MSEHVDRTPVKTRPAMTPEGERLYDWFKANGVDEWLPEDFGPIVIKADPGTLTYTSHVFEGDARGWDMGKIDYDRDAGDIRTERRTVPLVIPMPDDIRAIAVAAAEKLVADRAELLDRRRESLAGATRDHAEAVALAERELAIAHTWTAEPVVIT